MLYFYHISVYIYFNKKIKLKQTNFSLIQLIKVIPMFSLLNFAHYINIKFLLQKKVRPKRNEFSQIEKFSSFNISFFDLLFTIGISLFSCYFFYLNKVYCFYDNKNKLESVSCNDSFPIHEKWIWIWGNYGNLHFRLQTQVANTGCNYVIYYKC
jgi:hypothetical protein